MDSVCRDYYSMEKLEPIAAILSSAPVARGVFQTWNLIYDPLEIAGKDVIWVNNLEDLKKALDPTANKYKTISRFANSHRDCLYFYGMDFYGRKFDTPIDFNEIKEAADDNNVIKFSAKTLQCFKKEFQVGSESVFDGRYVFDQNSGEFSRNDELVVKLRKTYLSNKVRAKTLFKKSVEQSRVPMDPLIGLAKILAGVIFEPFNVVGWSFTGRSRAAYLGQINLAVQHIKRNKIDYRKNEEILYLCYKVKPYLKPMLEHKDESYVAFAKFVRNEIRNKKKYGNAST